MIRCCIFDLGGTIVDKYSLSPLLSLANAFGLRRITIPNHIISKDIGKTKIDHIVSLCKEPIVEGQFHRTYGRHISYTDIDNIFDDFNKLQVDYMTEHLDIIPQTRDIIKYLDDKSIRTGITTGFNREQMDIAINRLKLDGIVFGSSVSSSCIPNASRPNPDMIQRNMELLDIHDPKQVIKIDDTEIGIQEGINSGCYTVGVARWSINMNVYSQGEICFLDKSGDLDRDSILHNKLEESREKLRKAGADYVIDTLDKLPGIINKFII